MDTIGKGAKHLLLELSTQFNHLIKFLFNSLRAIDLSKFKSADKPIAERSVMEAKPRELNLPKSSLEISQPEAKQQESPKQASKTNPPKSESASTSTVYKSKDKNINSEMPSTDLLDRVLDLSLIHI